MNTKYTASDIRAGQIWCVGFDAVQEDRIELWIIGVNDSNMYYSSSDRKWQMSQRRTKAGLASFFESYKFRLISDLQEIAHELSQL